ncbi:MAG: hypothetical protein F2813_05165 [Actinobacteria bacterium]|uniref:Unannotated protein n=1 Tax=freshwater metagenome TaxID=449393 RepID=A0A6J5ZQY7_9ZZZZ|nr:hypothetical protein [Actinomycetota bacterium]
MTGDLSRQGLIAVADQLRAEEGLLAESLLPPELQFLAEDDPLLGGLAASGPRSAGREVAIALVVEAVYEGSLLHAGRSRILDPADEDLNILAGDRLYALGLATLADLGDLDSVRELADVIAICAQSVAQQEPALAAAAWQLGASTIGWGSSPACEAAKATVGGDPLVAATTIEAAAAGLRESAH